MAAPINREWRKKLQALKDASTPQRPFPHKEDFEHFIWSSHATSWRDIRDWAAAENLYFRGQKKSDWELLPSIERVSEIRIRDFTGRSNPGGLELEALREFQRIAHLHIAAVPGPAETIDWLALMQHHGAPTRMLDWTQSPYVALYFATCDVDCASSAAVWSIDASWLRECSGRILRRTLGIPDLAKESWRQYEPLCDIIDNQRSVGAVAVIEPKRSNIRMATQQGVLLRCLDPRRDFDLSLMEMIQEDLKLLPNPVIRKLIIPAELRPVVLRELIRLNITESSLFPGLDGASRSIFLRMRLSALEAQDLL